MENGETRAQVNWSGVEIQDARGDTPRMITMMDLEDAIAVAKAVLAFAEGMTFEDDDIMAQIFRMEDAEDARHDATSSHFGHD